MDDGSYDALGHKGTSRQTYDGEIPLDATEAIETLLTGLAGLLQLINPKNRMGSA